MENSDYLNDLSRSIEKITSWLQNELKNIKTGRATPAIIESMAVESYGVKMSLVQLASITAPEPNLLIVKPWDKNNNKAINAVLQKADLGATVSLEDEVIRIKFAPLTEERRKELVKKVKEKTEKARIKIRGLRDKIRETTIKQEHDREISEDEKYTRLEEIDKVSKEANNRLKEIVDQKEKEIMSI